MVMAVMQLRGTAAQTTALQKKGFLFVQENVARIILQINLPALGLRIYLQLKNSKS